ncbi:MAG: signal peptidase I [Candidatus Taylorbacteria bacterium]|nr:signal peptidase I [Candidatus Taylorbacteria bacterium]
MSEEKEKIPEEANKMAEEHFSHKHKEDSWWDIAKFALTVIAIILPIRFYVIQPFMVSGPSMVPTFEDKDYLLVDEISYHFQRPARGEIIVFWRGEEKKYLIKRIVGLPGETIILDGENVTVINTEHPEGLLLDQSYIHNKVQMQKQTYTLDDSHYFVLGDNRSVSYDSRGWGALPADEIVGRPIFRLYPFNMITVWPGEHLL